VSRFELRYRWLLESRDRLVAQGVISAERIGAVIEEERCRVECFHARSALLSMTGGRRCQAVFSLYRQGGYRYFSGWKSAVKDLLLNS
jgi:hypothetical protein